MKPCKDWWRERLAEHALGAPASDALESHLKECPRCVGALIEQRARAEQIDAGIRLLAASEPSPQSAARVLAVVRSSRRRRWVPERKRLAAVLAGIAILTVSGDYVWRVHRQRVESERVLSAGAAIARWRSPTQDLLRSPAHAWLKAPPRLGEYFYPLKTDVWNKEKEGP